MRIEANTDHSHFVIPRAISIAVELDNLVADDFVEASVVVVVKRRSTEKVSDAPGARLVARWSLPSRNATGTDGVPRYSQAVPEFVTAKVWETDGSVKWKSKAEFVVLSPGKLFPQATQFTGRTFQMSSAYS